MSYLTRLLGLSTEDQESITKTAGRITSVAEFTADLAKAGEAGNLLQRLGEIVPWWAQATGSALAEAAPPIKFIAVLLGKLGQVRDPNRLAYLAFTTAYQRAVEKALISVGNPSGQKTSPWSPKSDIPAEEMNFETYSLSDPVNHPFIQQADELLKAALTAAGYSDPQIRRIQSEVQIRFPSALKAILSHPSTHERFAALATFLQFANREERVRAAWNDHFEYQRYLFEDKPVFGEEPFALADVYVETECGLVTYGDLLTQSSSTRATAQAAPTDSKRVIDPFDERCGGRHDLVTTAMSLIMDKDFRDAIVIQGPAGSGKSAFTLRLSVELLKQGFNPIRIRFRDISLNYANIVDALPEAVRFWDPEQRTDDLPAARPEELFLDQNIFDQKIQDTAICPYVLILDGWDEVSVAAQKGFEVRIREMLSQIRDQFLRMTNRPIVRVILTGRPSDAVSGSSFLTKQTRLLTIRPLKPDALDPFVRNLAQRLADPLCPNLADPERFSPILETYAAHFANSAERQRNRSSTMEVLGLPLLTHLAVRLMVRWPHDDLQPIVEDPTALFRLLTDMTCVKGGRFGKDVFEPSLSGHELRRLLHETAAAMTVFGRDNIPYEELDARLSELNDNLVDRVKALTSDHPVSSLMISFFFKTGRTELGAEFLHKSFREYLFAEAVLETLKDYVANLPKAPPERDSANYWQDFSPTDPRYALSRRLGRLLGPQWLSDEIEQFLKGLISWELERVANPGSTTAGIPTNPISFDQWRQIRDTLADLWDWWGEGVHLRAQPQLTGKRVTGWSPPFVDELCRWALPLELEKGTIPAFPRSTAIDGHLGKAIFHLSALTHWYVAKYARPTPHDQTLPPPRRYQSLDKDSVQIRFKPSGPHPDYFRFFIDRINAAGWPPHTIFPVSQFMRGVDLIHTNLYLRAFEAADLRFARFGAANLFMADYGHANLQDADFEDSQIIGASFRGASVNRAVLKFRFADGSDFGETAVSSAKVFSLGIKVFDSHSDKTSPQPRSRSTQKKEKTK